MLFNYITYKVDLNYLLKRYIYFVNLNQYNISNLDNFKTTDIEKFMYKNLSTVYKEEPKKKDSKYFVIKRNL